MTINQRLKDLIEALGMSVLSFSKTANVSEATTRTYIVRGSKPNSDYLESIVRAFERVNTRWLLIGEGKMFNDEAVEIYQPPKEIVIPVATMPRVVTVDQSGRELVTLVPAKARAGYLNAILGDYPQYLATLPAFPLPMFSNGTFRAFEVEGYSMLQQQGRGLYPSDIAVGRAVESFREIYDGRVYIVLAETELEQGLIIKRCINRLESDGKLICNSDNRNGNFPPIILEASQIKEVWEYKGHITRQLPGPGEFDKLFSDMQAKLLILFDEYQKNRR